MKSLMTYILVVMAISISPLVTPLMAGPNMRVETVVVITSTGRYSFQAEIADTPSHRSQGLMRRPFMDADRGMLFDNGEDREMYMWMKNTILALDMIFITKNGTVVKIAKNTVPFSETVIPSGQPVRGVLEVIAGTSDKINLKPGDKIDHPLFR